MENLSALRRNGHRLCWDLFLIVFPIFHVFSISIFLDLYLFLSVSFSTNSLGEGGERKSRITINYKQGGSDTESI